MDFKLKISRKTALEKVRVAKALWFLPKVDAVFKEGALSYSQVRALTRVATRENESDLVDRALTTTACNLEKYCHRLRLGEVQSGEREARRQHENRALHLAVEDGGLHLLNRKYGAQRANQTTNQQNYRGCHGQHHAFATAVWISNVASEIPCPTNKKTHPTSHG
ncbi:MAG: hypothetical protein ACI9ON_000096 [Limisphaerales bacterium]|jgi:hypothetical protein